LIEGVSDTAFWVAHYRALESQRPDALFHVPFAALLAGDRGKKIAKSMPMPFITGWAVVIRTCIIDDYIQWALAQGVDAVLNLGAGLDARPYRMELPDSLIWIEADYPQIVEYKETRLANEKTRCRLERVSIDLTKLPERRALLASVQARAKKILVLTEGVVPYLTVEDAASLADDLKNSSNACYWIVDYFSREVIKQRGRRMRFKMQNAPFRFDPADWFGFFAEHGWRVREIRYLLAEGQRLHRPIRLPLFISLFWVIRRLFIPKERRAAFAKFAAYVLLERSAA